MATTEHLFGDGIKENGDHFGALFKIEPADITTQKAIEIMMIAKTMLAQECIKDCAITVFGWKDEELGTGMGWTTARPNRT